MQHIETVTHRLSMFLGNRGSYMPTTYHITIFTPNKSNKFEVFSFMNRETINQLNRLKRRSDEPKPSESKSNYASIESEAALHWLMEDTVSLLDH